MNRLIRVYFIIEVMPSGKALAVIGTAGFLVVAPGFVVGLVPWWISHWRVGPPFLGLPALRVLGGVLTAAGIAGLLDSFARFALQGIGTPAPVYPTRHLVVTGLYCYVRNPMYVAVILAIAGQAVLFGNWWLLIYAGIVWTVAHAFIVLYEEPTLTATFGDEYRRYRARVPRWIPRFRRLQ